MADNQFPQVPLSIPDTGQHLRLVSTSLNNTINGKLNSTGTITLTASATSTTLTDARTALNGLHVSARADGSATLTHASSGNTDQNLSYCIIG